MEHVLQFVAQYGYLAVFVIMMLGMLWVPLPEETFLTAIGVLTAQGHIGKVHVDMALVPAILCAYLGTTLGITGVYVLGRTAGFGIVRRFGKLIRVTPQRLRKAHDWFDRHGKWTLTFGYYVPYVRHINALVAGTTKIRYGEFALFAYPGGLLWVVTFICLGRFVGDRWGELAGPIKRIILIGTVALAVLMVIYLIVRAIRRRGKS